MTPAPVHLLSERLMLDPGGALFWPREGLLALAGLTIERGALERFAALLRRWGPRRVVLLGAGGGSARFEAMAASVPFVQVGGDGSWGCPPLVFREGPAAGARGEVSGHALPCFVADGARIVLPPFGAEGAEPGADDRAVRALFPHGGRVFLPGRERLASFRLAGRFGR
jgi:hypothetical protein